ncbi:MAG: DUF134 domain-containing protein [Eubacteriales bacterium]|nr:DUF134 domain-containing protein [Eubacteriales bacterium]
MPRTEKCRRVCAEPVSRVFSPDVPGGQSVTLTVVELEALRLCDLEGLEQDMSAARMQISRGTLQRILYAARRTIAHALVGGCPLHIEGGNYQLTQAQCRCTSACRQCRFQ